MDGAARQVAGRLLFVDNAGAESESGGNQEMTSATSRLAPIVLLIMATTAGCASLSFHQKQEVCSHCEGEGECSHCQSEECKPPRRYSDEWWAIEADRPVGARQKYKKGKMWPPYPRPTEKKQHFWHQYHAAHYWPHPYVCEDRNSVRSMAELQINNGWISETTIYDYHFDEETLELNHSGELHLRWIMQHAPEHRRLVWVQTAFNTDVSQQRLDNVRESAIAMVGEANIPPISLRVATPTGRPALEVDVIRRAEIESIPEPRIIYEALPGGTGGS
jgi:hypothetical protein